MTRELEAAKRRLRAEFTASPAAEAGVVRAAGVSLAGFWSAEPRLSACERVALYAAQEAEMPTRPLFEALRARGCAPLFPRCGDGVLNFARIEVWEELQAGRYGIPEPPPRRAGESLGPGDAVLVPGLAFDAAGHRLGRGAGWYDRSFPVGSPGPYLVGATFECRLLPAVPHGSRDRDMDAIVTETGFRWVRGEA